MWKLPTFDGRLAPRNAFIPHAISAVFLLFAGFLVVGFAQLGGGDSPSPSPRTYVSGCSHSASTTLTNVGYYTPTTATVTRYRTVTKTITRTRTIYRTRTKFLCQTITVTGPGSTTTETTTEQGPTTTVTETSTEKGPTTTVTETTTVTATQSGSTAGSAFTCPATDQLGFAVGVTDYTSDPFFCSYPAVQGEDPNDFFCTYSATTGALVEDHDAGLCAATAPAKP